MNDPVTRYLRFLEHITQPSPGLFIALLVLSVTIPVIVIVNLIMAVMR